MTKLYNYYILLIIALGLTSCDDNLEINPRQDIDGSQVFTSEQNIDALLLGIYQDSGQDLSYGGDIQITNDLIGTSDQVSWFGTFVQPRQFIQKNILVDNSFVRDTWANNYESINQSNLIIDNLDIVTSSDAKRDQVEGEAKYLRALNYFGLITLWALPYEAGTVNSQPGVPLRLTGYEDYSQPLPAERASVEDIYAQILVDLQDAYDKLPADNGIFASKYAAQALRARVYLQMQDYAAARDSANDVIANSGASLTPTFAGAFNNDANSSEDLFAFQVTNQTGDNDFITFYASEGNGGRGGDIALNPAYFALFPDPDDVRANFTYIGDFGDDLTAKYTNQFANVVVSRLAEMYLIRAEGNIIENTAVGATPVDDINELRDRANADPVAGPLTQDDILLERQLELAFEGFLLQDLKRTKSDVDGLPYDDPSLVLPIPQNEMDTNNLIEQNPGYGS
ncbi:MULTISPECIES: RagB/SusD family nutrient uptake outer membrane protein [unclassified Leeuwenhoekiella]|uniref:RagB/SusD family nutrient uptake outer membrane protein n=1 Tax=unclassified Leeuwenhoekiella TaxID=2615029 RepID=UPI000C6A9F37|nr:MULTISPECIES: RagB/SusD family nutrient uptake outer membrane protein [unclassified Leeuwenhoekiella]MAW96514.1 RagB/SusD family nutrient uptake outer membrane protein [Leeuwenhoekiella sp.]MBA81401.1 RagB/SusD family nutrient uptake outer membrane protein [Leeuwenhoekiella sp.]|tara:strand:- start:13509 stop:14870 length:1362 start_codon:yes stop_codon:yes gene_type:complete